nr:baculoviral IAP repeat-containing protein 8-like [Coffea arabica]
MDGQYRPNRLWKTMMQRLRIKMMACCGSSINLRVSDSTVCEEEAAQAHESHETEEELQPMMATVGHNIQARGISLATLLAAERQLRKVGPRKHKKPLMRLFEEVDGVDSKKGKWYRGGNDNLCCVCMVRNRGAAFIPCGHTYCRECSRALWLKRVPCPLCNHPINQILDIF